MNKVRWQYFQHSLRTPSELSPDELGEMYTYITDDLAYAQCYFPESQTTEFLNGLAMQFHTLIYSNKKIERRDIWKFWREELPELLYSIRMEILLSFLIFAVSFLAGLFSVFQDQSYIRAILGDDYVNMTLENIAHGDPMGVYKTGSSFGAFIFIFFNNVKVAIIAYIFGILLSFGSMYVLFKNGTMVAAFVSIFYIYGGMNESLHTIWMHGAIEMCAIVLSAAAGLHLGKGLLFPGTLSRKLSLVEAAQRSGRVLLALIPFIGVAAYIEGYVTRHTEWPDWIRATFIWISLLFMIVYFVVYPLMYHHQHKNIRVRHE